MTSSMYHLCTGISLEVIGVDRCTRIDLAAGKGGYKIKVDKKLYIKKRLSKQTVDLSMVSIVLHIWAIGLFSEKTTIRWQHNCSEKIFYIWFGFFLFSWFSFYFLFFILVTIHSFINVISGVYLMFIFSSAGAIAGGVIGGIVALAVICTIVICVCVKVCKTQNHGQVLVYPQQPAVYTSSST